MILMLCYARSGGTLLNRILVALPNTIVMSEVHPFGGGWGVEGRKSYTTIQSQAKNWYGIHLKTKGYYKSLEELNRYCLKNDKKLITREWSYINFKSHKYNKHNPPNKFIVIEKIKDKNPTIFALVRNSIDVWISLGKPNIDTFSSEYLKYVNELINLNCSIFKYEDLCEHPNKTVKKLCDNIGLEYSDSYKRFADVKNVNGDTQHNKILSKNVLPPRRKLLKISEIIKLQKNYKIKQANKLLGYPVNYFDGNLMSVKTYIKKYFKK